MFCKRFFKVLKNYIIITGWKNTILIELPEYIKGAASNNQYNKKTILEEITDNMQENLENSRITEKTEN